MVLVVPEHGKDIAGRPAAGGAGALALDVPGKAGGATTVLQTPAGAEDAGPFRIEAVDYQEHRRCFRLRGHQANEHQRAGGSGGVRAGVSR